jgi:uncharacterized protein (DUF1330 family)
VSAYFIALINIHDSARYEEYLAGFDEVFEQYLGEVVVVEDEARVLEGKWPASRTVVIRFPSEEALRAWYESPDYQSLARHRHAAAEASVAIVTGRDTRC